jgi:hypothetical protein
MKTIEYYYNFVAAEKEDKTDEKAEALRIGDVIKRRRKQWAIVDIQSNRTFKPGRTGYFISVFLTGPLDLLPRKV